MSKENRNARWNQMSAQEAMIAKKKAEIEEKKKKSLEEKETKESEIQKAAPIANQFLNDGSFMEQFMKTMKKKEEEEEEGGGGGGGVGVKTEVTDKLDVTKTEINDVVKTETKDVAKTEVKDVVKTEVKDVTKMEVKYVIKTETVVKTEPKEDTIKPCSSEKENLPPLPVVADELASMVALSGDHLEAVARETNADEDELAFLFNVDSPIYKAFRYKVEELRRDMKQEQKSDGPSRRKKSRWGDENDKVILPPPDRSPEVIQYAIRVFGSLDIEPHQWKQCEDQIKMNSIYNDILAKQQRNLILAEQGKHKYEYDSDEDVEGGTWEHKQRMAEMEKTLDEAQKLTKAAEGKHHIGDFLPPEELTKFMAKYQALKNGEDFDESDYQKNKLTEENKGFQLLQKMGWNEGAGLGSSGQGITNPVSSSGQGTDKKGLGVSKPHELEMQDDEFDAYRKRMMMAYKFRPNPLNNPRRSYY